MCPAGRVLYHPTADTLLEYATFGCPTRTRKKWSREEMQAAIDFVMHMLVMQPEAMEQLKAEVSDKV